MGAEAFEVLLHQGPEPALEIATVGSTGADPAPG
jgi:hypothetical protein